MRTKKKYGGSVANRLAAISQEAQDLFDVGWLEEFGSKAVEENLLLFNKESCVPPLSAAAELSEIHDIAFRIGKYDPAQPQAAPQAYVSEDDLVVDKVAEVRTTTIPDSPEAVLCGRLGEIYQRRLKDFPITYAWPSLLTAAGVLVPMSPRFDGSIIHDDDD